jgi:redox-sensitive bicupin YhaK (pirin superfamily)
VHRLNGEQLWVALPDAHRHVDPSFDGIKQVPVIETPGGITQVFADRSRTLPRPAAFSARGR